jgi:hypothetical protein
MQIHGGAKLLDALLAWAVHEAPGRALQQLPGQIHVDINDPLACMEFILWWRASVIAGLLARRPVMTLKGTFNAADVSSLVLFDGRTVDSWIAETKIGGGVSLKYFDELVQGSMPLSGSLLVGAQMIAPPPNLQIRHQILYEGWHRSGAIVERARGGMSDTTDGYLVLTQL